MPWHAHVVVHPLDHVRGQIRAGQNEVHTRKGQRCGRVDRPDAGVRVRAAQEGHVPHARQPHVVDVVASTGEDPPVLDPFDAGPDEPADHRAPSSSVPWIASAARRTPSTIDW